ncbi:hypothetical protein [Sphaerisporangium fuscum]|uniref:hypothetical protein n=1 Tax=Sphaerisporangium fuscum TaxID=2835868 RepID=UPI001BDD5EE5|nr:hypothetical protein [Sphaerisporangium fuscum]
MADVLLAGVVRAGRDRLVDVLDGDRFDVDDHLAVAGDRVGEVLIARNAAGLVEHRCLHPGS